MHTDWQNLIQGSEQAISKLFSDYYDSLYRYASRFENDTDTIKDTIQELFYNLWKNHTRLVSVDNIKAYLFKSLRNIWLNKKQKSFQLTDEFNENIFIYFPDDFNPEPDDLMEKKFKLTNVLNELPAKQREAIYLKYFQGLDIDEIAVIMNQNNQSVRNNLHRAMIKLREKMLLNLFFLSV